MICYAKGPLMIRTAVESDLPRIAENLRESDAAEVYYSHRHTPSEALAYSFGISDPCLTLVYKGRPIAIFGLAPTGAKTASAWLLGTREIPSVWPSFLRLSRAVIDRFLDLYPVLFNYVDAGNYASQRWLQWLGAKFDDPEPHGPLGCRFRRFVIERKVPCATLRQR